MELSSMGLLGYDALYSIFDIVSDYSRTQLAECTLVCKSWRAIAQPFLDRKIEFCLRPRSKYTDAKVLSRLMDDAFRSNVREIAIGKFQNYAEAKDLDDLAWQMLRMTLLRFRWHRTDPLPKSLLEALEIQQHCEMHFALEKDPENCYSVSRGQLRGYCADRLPSLLPIARSLVSLDVASIDLDQSPIYLGQLISKARQLRSLHIIGGSISLNRWRWISPPELNNINLVRISLLNFCVCTPGAWDQWENLVLWERLKEATFTCPSVILCAGHKLCGLNKLDITAHNQSYRADLEQHHGDSQLIQGMLRSLGPSLQSLHFSGPIQTFETTCISHLSSLESLRLRGLKYPTESDQAAGALKTALNLGSKNHPLLKEVYVQLPKQCAEYYQLDTLLTQTVTNLSYVERITAEIDTVPMREYHTWDFSRANRIWERVESFAERFTPRCVVLKAAGQTRQQIEINMALEIACKTEFGKQRFCHVAKVARRWHIRCNPTISSGWVDRVRLEENWWNTPRNEDFLLDRTNKTKRCFLRQFPELHSVAAVEYVSGGNQYVYARMQSERRAVDE